MNDRELVNKPLLVVAPTFQHFVDWCCTQGIPPNEPTVRFIALPSHLAGWHYSTPLYVVGYPTHNYPEMVDAVEQFLAIQRYWESRNAASETNNFHEVRWLVDRVRGIRI